jgi:3-phosphoshikimate 1-carboxyvinyltransferase
VNYLKNGTLLPIFENDPNDIKVVYNALKTISENSETSGEVCVIDVEDCGAAYRFLMAVLAATKGKWLLTGTNRLLQRPILPLVNFLNAHGANIQQTASGWQIEGAELQIDDFEIETDETSQFASALVMVSSERYAESGKRYAKNPYIRMTEAILDRFTEEMTKLADWSAAGFWIAKALLTPNAHYFLKDLHFDGLQGDAELVRWFSQWGVSFAEKEDGIEVKHIHKVEILEPQIDVAQTPDMAMILATLAVCYPFELTLSGLKNINLKESNRLDIIVNELSKFTKVEKRSHDVIHIQKRTDDLPPVFHFDSYNDHRFVMAWSLFNNFGTVTIRNADCIKKSYPHFPSPH